MPASAEGQLAQFAGEQCSQALVRGYRCSSKAKAFIVQIVAQYLQLEAQNRSDVMERDLFGRSAFNRYYYATFLEVKKGLGSLKTEWATMAHAGVPEVLRGTVQRELKQGMRKALKLSDSEVVSLCERAKSAVLDLADLMERGYAIRVAADYHPEISVDFSDGSNFKLNTVTVRDARTWPSRAEVFMGVIVSAWKQVHA
ncbi:hypothetical protein [Burkholderia gladioli]|uniref:hypothetical protein n=1 Tax=Burkholderia gladioli TaxID=28095 RepID=UPI00163F8E08|nr:hypothetical protein [Burkholderia gladioli]